MLSGVFLAYVSYRKFLDLHRNEINTQAKARDKTSKQSVKF